MVNDNSWTGLCKDCSGKIFTLLVKLCPECKAEETNSRWKRCPTCAIKKDECCNCDAKLPVIRFATGALPPPKRSLQ